MRLNQITIVLSLCLVMLFVTAVYASSSASGTYNGKSYTIQTTQRRYTSAGEQGDQVRGRNDVQFAQTVATQSVETKGFNNDAIGWHQVGHKVASGDNVSWVLSDWAYMGGYFETSKTYLCDRSSCYGTSRHRLSDLGIAALITYTSNDGNHSTAACWAVPGC